MLAGCLTLATTTALSTKSPSDLLVNFNKRLNDGNPTNEVDEKLETKIFAVKKASMTKQLTRNSTTTNSNGTIISNANNVATATSTLALSPTTAPTANATSSLSNTEPHDVKASDGCDAKLLHRSASNCDTEILPNPPATSSLVNLTATNDGLSSVRVNSDASGRSAALERAYVHDVYANCEEPTGQTRPRIAQFLNNLEPGSVVCDVGCGNGRYLAHANPATCIVGVDRCYRLSKLAREKGGEVMVCDNLELPFRDESFDAVLSLAVVHHFATTERRVIALRELARILRIGGRVIITVWALEQRHRRFESQDVLIPWQAPKIRNLSCSDDEDDDNFLPPYHAYTEDSTNSSRSAGDGDSSSLSSSSPGESCYSFVRRAIQKLAAGRRHPWFLDSWTSKETKNDSSLDFEDVKDLPIELRRLEDFDDFHDPPLSAGLKSRSLGSILNPPPRQIVRSRSSVPSLGGAGIHADINQKAGLSNPHLVATNNCNGSINNGITNSISPTKLIGAGNAKVFSSSASLGRRPKLIKQKQSLCDEEYQLPENPFHMISTYNSVNNGVNNSLYLRGGGCYYNSTNNTVNSQAAGTPANANNLQQQPSLTARQMMQASLYLRKQSSLNEELMAVNRLREKERVRKRIQKQTSLNEAFLCRSAIFSKKLHVIRENFTKKMKNSSGSIERATKTGINKLVQNLSSYVGPTSASSELTEKTASQRAQINATAHTMNATKCNKYNRHHHHHHPFMQTQLQQQQSLNIHNYQRKSGATIHAHEKSSPTKALQKQLSLGSGVNKYGGPVTYCNSPECTTSACYCSTYHYTGCSSFCTITDGSENKEDKARRHSHESGSDSSKDSSLQSDTSIESEDSFASVIFIPKPEQHQQQLNYQQQHQNSNSSSSNSSSSNGGGMGVGGGCAAYGNCCQHKNGTCKMKSNGHSSSCITCLRHQQHANHQRAPTSPLIMPCPPTPAHSPATTQAAVTSPPKTVATVAAAMAILTPPCNNSDIKVEAQTFKDNKDSKKETTENRFNFDEAHIKQHENDKCETEIKHKAENKEKVESSEKITRQIIKNLPPIPKFRKQQSLQTIRQHFPIVRRSSGTSTTSLPSVPKLMSLELFNPATDDLDSDSSEASTPNSIDSVISAGKPNTAATNLEKENMENELISENTECEKDYEEDLKRSIELKKQQYCNGELKISSTSPNNFFLNEEDNCPMPQVRAKMGKYASSLERKEPDCAEFAEQVSAQLLKKIEDKPDLDDCENSDLKGNTVESLETHIPSSAESLGKKRANELRELSAIREELRERRLMLANLSIQSSLQQSPASSTSSLSSQTRSFTIHEENEEESDERSYSLQLYENCKISKINCKRNRPYNLNPETAYLLQDDSEIFEEEEEEEEVEEFNRLHKGIESKDYQSGLKARKQTVSRTNKSAFRYDSRESDVIREQKDNKDAKGERGSNKEAKISLQNRQSTESLGNSNSSTGSLESPTQGGATTHHRYYHVFREGELDALINHHVSSLHIVSSYYERASWCVVCEKVQVWTI